MNKQEVHCIGNLTIHPGKLQEFTEIAREIIAATRKEPGSVGYDFLFNADGSRCRVVEIYRDADAMLAHMTGPVMRDIVPKLMGTMDIGGFEVYGDPGPKGTEVLTALGATIFERKHELSL